MKTDFGRGKWTCDNYLTAYSYRFDPALPFVQKDDCIEAPVCNLYRDGYASISLLEKNKFAPGITIRTECDFEGIAAPLIVIAEDVKKDENGIIRYDNYFEVVIYKNGVNMAAVARKRQNSPQESPQACHSSGDRQKASADNNRHR